MKEIKHYVNSPVPALTGLLSEDDRIPFSVLVNILHVPCAHTVTDHENLIVCHSTRPYPVWVWCKDVQNAEIVAQISAYIQADFPTEQGYRWNMTYELFEALKKADPYFTPLTTEMGLLSYRMDELLPVTHPCDGFWDTAKAEETELLCKLWHDACLEMEGFDHPRDFCLAKVTSHLEKGTLFTWRNADGVLTAMVGRRDSPPFSKIGPVYTVPGHRRKGYAMNLVHAVSAGMLKDKLIPILYTDANYPASNACYQKIGYRQVGALCCAGKKK